MESMESLEDVRTYGVCRCCLSTGNHRHIMKEYFFNGVREIYIHIFMDCLNLFLRTDAQLTMLICSDCVKRLRDVYSFRQKVAATERHLLNMIDKEPEIIHVKKEMDLQEDERDKLSESNTRCDGTPGTHRDKGDDTVHNPEEKNTTKSDQPDSSELIRTEDIKIEVEVDLDYSGAQQNPLLGIPDEYDPLNIDTSKPDSKEIADGSVTCFTNIAKDFEKKIKVEKDSKKSEKVKGVKRKVTDDSDSDTPLSSVAKNCKTKRVKKEMKGPGKYSAIYLANLESRKDNDKVRSNMLLLLKNSTIIPFRKIKVQYKCFYCEETNLIFSELKKHNHTDHRDLSEQTIDKSIKAVQELIVTADISTIQCRICEEKLRTIEDLIEHLTKIHEKVYHETRKQPSHGILGFDIGSDTFKCHICCKEFSFFKSLYLHMNDHFARFECEICARKCLTEQRLKNHMFFAHANDDETGSKCKHCGDIFKSRAALGYHVKKEHAKSILKCPECPITFPFTKYVDRLNHMEQAHNIKKPLFECDLCGHVYGSSMSLSAHKRNMHIRGKNFRCDICGFETIYKSYYKDHVNIHNGIIVHRCEVCKKTFPAKNNLKLHMRIHLNEKKYVCSLCQIPFAYKATLMTHLKSQHPGIDGLK